MEHLLLVADGELTEHDVVPYVADERYRGVDFFEYVQRGKGSRDLSEEFLWARSASEAEIDTFIQTALFFCVFEQVLGEFFVRENYIREVPAIATAVTGTFQDDPHRSPEREPPASSLSSRNRPQRVLCTALLIDAIESWAARQKRFLEEGRRAAVGSKHHDPDFEVKITELGNSYNLLFQTASSYSHIYEGGRGQRSIWISIRSSLSLLSLAVSKTFDLKHVTSILGQTVETRMILYGHGGLPSIPPVDLNVMRANGWCPFDAQRAWKEIEGIETQMMLRSMRAGGNAAGEHDLCTTEYCTTDLKNGPFKIKHATPDCMCAMWCLEMSELSEIIEAGRLPLLRAVYRPEGSFSEEKFNMLGFELVASDGDIPYAAISHVWKDGLANPFANALPRCQLYKLVESLDMAFKNESLGTAEFAGHFWLDPICCPVKPLDLKVKVLASMRDIYENCSFCLVLDAEVRATQSAGLHILEKALRVGVSRWTRRLWTAQEGLLAPSLFFCFADAWIPSKQLSLELFTLAMSHTVVGGVTAMGLMTTISRSQRDFSGNLTIDSMDVRSIWNLVKDRSVSVDSDEAICLGVLINENLATKESIKGENMARFWAAVARRGLVWSRIIFWQGPFLIDVPNFHWAPASLLSDNVPGRNIDYMVSHAFSEAARLHPRGLEVNFEGFLLEQPGMSLQRQFDSQDSNEGPWIPYVIVCDSTGQQWWTLFHRWIVYADQVVNFGDEHDGDSNAVPPSRAAIVLYDTKEQTNAIHLTGMEGFFGLVATVVEEQRIEANEVAPGANEDEKENTCLRHFVRSHCRCFVMCAQPAMTRLLTRLFQDHLEMGGRDEKGRGGPGRESKEEEEEEEEEEEGELQASPPADLVELCWAALLESATAEAQDRERNADLPVRYIQAVLDRFRIGQYLQVKEHLPRSHTWVVD